jgi:hypothetical protein
MISPKVLPGVVDGRSVGAGSSPAFTASAAFFSSSIAIDRTLPGDAGAALPIGERVLNPKADTGRVGCWPVELKDLNALLDVVPELKIFRVIGRLSVGQLESLARKNRRPRHNARATAHTS